MTPTLISSETWAQAKLLPMAAKVAAAVRAVVFLRMLRREMPGADGVGVAGGCCDGSLCLFSRFFCCMMRFLSGAPRVVGGRAGVVWGDGLLCWLSPFRIPAAGPARHPRAWATGVHVL